MHDTPFDRPSDESVPTTIQLVEDVEPTPIIHSDSTLSAETAPPDASSLPLLIADSSIVPSGDSGDTDAEILDGILTDDEEDSEITS